MTGVAWARQGHSRIVTTSSTVPGHNVFLALDTTTTERGTIESFGVVRHSPDEPSTPHHPRRKLSRLLCLSPAGPYLSIVPDDSCYSVSPVSPGTPSEPTILLAFRMLPSLRETLYQSCTDASPRFSPDCCEPVLRELHRAGRTKGIDSTIVSELMPSGIRAADNPS